MIWFKHVQKVDSELMRDIAADAGVSWDETTILYRNGHVGYADAPDTADKQAIIDAADASNITLRDSQPPTQE